jgi:hypothetical protein
MDKEITEKYKAGLRYLVNDDGKNYDATQDAERNVARYLLIDRLQLAIAELEQGNNPYDMDSDIGRKVDVEVAKAKKQGIANYLGE